VLSIQTPMGLSFFVVDKCSVPAPTSPLSVHGTAVSVAARIRTAVALDADLPGPPRGAPV
jgi:hypothetical protein